MLHTFIIRHKGLPEAELIGHMGKMHFPLLVTGKGEYEGHDQIHGGGSGVFV